DENFHFAKTCLVEHGAYFSGFGSKIARIQTNSRNTKIGSQFTCKLDHAFSTFSNVVCIDQKNCSGIGPHKPAKRFQLIVESLNVAVRHSSGHGNTIHAPG